MQKKYLLAKWLLIYNLVILYDMCIDSAYAGNSTCTAACAETIHYLHTQYRLIEQLHKEV